MKSALPSDPPHLETAALLLSDDARLRAILDSIPTGIIICDHAGTVTLINEAARKLYRQIDRAHRDFLPEHIELLANIVRLYRGEAIETVDGSEELMGANFPDGTYIDVPGLCKVATIDEIEAQGWSLNPGRYTGTATEQDDGIDFQEKLEELYEEFTKLNDEAEVLRTRVDAAITGVLDA